MPGRLRRESEKKHQRGGGKSQSTQTPRLRAKALEKEPLAHHNLLDLVKKMGQVVIRMLSGWETKEERREGLPLLRLIVEGLVPGERSPGGGAGRRSHMRGRGWGQRCFPKCG